MSLDGKKGLIVGIANRGRSSLGCARGAPRRRCGACCYLSECAGRTVSCARSPNSSKVRSLFPAMCASRVNSRRAFSHVRDQWGRLDFLLHSIAYAPKEDPHSRITDCSQAGFAMAMDVSCHSFIRMARLAEPLMTDGGCLLTITFYGSEKVVEDYNLMGPVKAALESCVRYLAAELGPKRIRVHALSPGPLKTRAASGIERFDELLERVRSARPSIGLWALRTSVTLPRSWSATHAALTGNIEYVDAGYHIVG